MKVTFRETMSGTTDDGRRFTFTVEVEAPRASSLALSEMLRVTGFAELEGLATHAPIDGTLVIGLPWRPSLEYELAMHADDGAIWRFSGKKSVALLHPVKTMTTLPGVLYRDGAEVMGCRLHFALGELPSLVASVRLATDRRATAGGASERLASGSAPA